MPKGDPAGYLPNVKKARKAGKAKKAGMMKGKPNPFMMAAMKK